MELWIDNSGAIGGLLKGYSGVPDCARIISFFHFTIAKLGIASLWIDYLPSKSNPADAPSRFHEMTRDAIIAVSASLGVLYTAVILALATHDGRWLSFSQIASSIFLGRRYTLPYNIYVSSAGCLSATTPLMSVPEVHRGAPRVPLHIEDAKRRLRNLRSSECN